MEKLRDEIIESQKIRADLIKWKLILTAVLGAAGLGLEKGNMEDTALLLCLIPFVCIYVDLAARHQNLRIFVIAKFIREEKKHTSKDDSWMVRYEELVHNLNKRVFGFESYILQYSTVVLSIIIILIGFSMSCLKDNALERYAFCTSGIIGIIAAFLIDIYYKKYRKDLI